MTTSSAEMTSGRFAACVVVFLAASAGATAHGAKIDFLLTVNVVTNTWELSASTDSPGGIAGFAVNLANIETGTSVAPRSVYGNTPIKGFTVAMHDLPIPQLAGTPSYCQAAAGQLALDVYSIVYGIGYVPVPDSDFGVQPPTIGMVGSALAVPTNLYVGTYNPANGLPGYQTNGQGIPNYKVAVANVYIAPPPPGGYDRPVTPNEITLDAQIVNYNLLVVPEPQAFLLFLIGMSLVFLTGRDIQRHRRAAQET
jgi:hypothetical protein